MLISRYKIIIKVNLTLLIILITSPLFALEPVILDENLSEYPLGLHIEYLEDKEKIWTIKDVRSDKLSKQFVRSKVKVPSFGFTESAYWVRFTVKNSLDKELRWYLEINYALIDQLNLYIPKKNNQYINKKTGDNFPFNEREIKHKNFVFSLTETPNEQKTYYIRFETTINSMILPLTMWSPKAFLEKTIYEHIALGLFYGIMLVMIFYNLFLYFSIRDISYLNYVIFIFGMMIMYLAIDGISFQYLPFDLGFWIKNNGSLIVFFTFVWVYQFTRSFLNISRQDLTLYRIIMFFTFLGISGFLVSLFISNYITLQLATTFAMITVCIAIVAAFLRFKKGYRPARYFLIAWFILILGVLALSLRSLGLLPDNIFTQHAVKLGSVIEVILLSLALADRINIMKHEKEEAQAEAIQNQQLAIDNLHKADQLKDEFLAKTSHELRTPISGIIGITESLMDGVTGKLPDKTIANLSMIKTSGNRLSHLINDILDFSKLKHKDITLQIKPLDIKTLVDVVLAISRPLVGKKSVILINSIDSGTPMVAADENRVQQILYNLIGNAIKFTDSGTIRVGAEQCSAPTQDEHIDSLLQEYLEVTVSDTGIGIPKDQLNSIFDSFQQVDSSDSREYAGTGLGLSITKQFVKLHGGQISVESTVGEWSRFTFTLPISKTQVDVIPVSPLQEEPLITAIDVIEPITVSSDDINNFPKGDPCRILIVDDDPINIQVLTNFLSFGHFHVTKAASGHEALKILEESIDKRFDLILLDVMMPKMSGYELCKRVREVYPPINLPIIMLTAKNQITDIVEGFDSGANDYLTKPVSKQELLARTNTQINFVKLYEEKISIEKEFTRLTTRIHSSLKNKLGAAQNFLLHYTQSDNSDTDDLIHLEKLISHCNRESQNILFTIDNKECTLQKLCEELILKAELSFYILEISYTIQKNYPDENITMKPEVVQYILDIYTECLDNIVKHASAANVDISIDYTDNQLTLSVRDDGVGFNYLKQKEKADSYGLDILDQLTKEVNGSLTIDSAPGDGTLVKSSVINE